MHSPSAVHAQATTSDRLEPLRAQGNNRWSGRSCDVRLVNDTIEVTASGELSRVAVRWAIPVPEQALILGDAWERSYGDLQWRHLQPERILPWYWLAHHGERTFGMGVDVQPSALCGWTVDTEGITLWLDLRNGGGPVTLGDRTLRAATVRWFEDAGDPWSTLDAAIEAMAAGLPSRPNPGPVVGANNWYYAYGAGFDRNAVLQDARTVVELADGHPVRPFSVIDDGWSPGDICAGGPWDAGVPGVFDDMSAIAGEIKAIGARPGLWFRPLLSRLAGPWGRPGPCDGPGRALDPTHPEVLDLVRADLERFRTWGFELVKHDFSTYDLLGRFAWRMGARMTDSGWHLADRSRTTAEVVLDLYRVIREAAADMTVLGCNTIGHLAAGLVDVQRTGDDTSGRDWGITRKMGVNTLAFRLPQHRRFFVADADCVPCTPQTPWELNRQFLDLVARSGTALFVSVDPAARTPDIDRDLSAAIRTALDGGSGSLRPVDWLHTTTPRTWTSNGETLTYRWSEPWGSDPTLGDAAAG